MINLRLGWIATYKWWVRVTSTSQYLYLLGFSPALDQRQQPDLLSSRHKDLWMHFERVWILNISRFLDQFRGFWYIPKVLKWFEKSSQISINFVPSISSQHWINSFICSTFRTTVAWISLAEFPIAYVSNVSFGHVECERTSANDSPLAVVIVAQNVSSNRCKSSRIFSGLVDGMLPVRPITRGCTSSS